MSADEIARTVADLREGTVDLVPVDRDWNEGYGEMWDYVEAPCCGECGGRARWLGHGDLQQIADDMTDAERVEFVTIDDVVIGLHDVRCRRQGASAGMTVVGKPRRQHGAPPVTSDELDEYHLQDDREENV